MIILAIESSCDETGVAILEVDGDSFNVRANLVNSQIKIHQKTSGVVPEVAARRHVQVINPLFEQALDEAQVSMHDIDLIAVTYGPGLIGSLIIGVEMAKTLSALHDIPIIGINHLKAHLQSNYFNLERNTVEDITYPAMGLLVSGGHTELVLITSPTDFEVVGQTLDDAVGESFDKVARLLGLPYPGGPQIARLAEKGDPEAYDLPIPMKQSGDLNFSYSGLKTAVRELVRSKSKWSKKEMANLCASFQSVAIQHLINKTTKALKHYNAKTLIVSGGVSANKELRSKLEELSKEKNVDLRVPPFHLCTDNALMIAMAAYIEYRQNAKVIDQHGWEEIKAISTVNI